MSVGRTFGLIAAGVAAGLAVLIGFVAYSAHHQDDGARRGGGGATAPPMAHGNMTAPLIAASAVNAVPVGPPVEGSSPHGSLDSGGGSPSGGGSVFVGGGGATQSAAVAVAPRSCSPGLIASLVGTLSSLLGGGGAC